MIRIKSIDTFRGIAVIAMIWLHLSEWWLSGDAHSFLDVPMFITQYGFLVSYQFISGVSRYLFYKTGGSKMQALESIDKRRIKREFLTRGFFLLIVALLYNSVVAISTSRPSEIWSWFILLSISISIIMITPLLDTSKRTRFFLGAACMVLNFSLLYFLQDFEGKANIYGLLFHILFYPTGLHPILSSFAVFLIGTVVGDLIHHIYYKAEKKDRLSLLKKSLIFPSIVSGLLLVTFIFLAKSFHVLNIPSFYGIISSLGISLILISLYLLHEESEIFNVSQKYNFIFYFSYYSLTIYLAHNVLYFLFFERLDAITSIISIIILILIIGLTLKLIYPKLGGSISIKKLISKYSTKLVMRFEGKKRQIK
jgi:uncharacterized membrane protein